MARHKLLGIALLLILPVAIVLIYLQYPTTPPQTYENSLIVAPHYVEYLSDSDERFMHQSLELKRRLGSAPSVWIGFAATLPIQIPAGNLNQPLTEAQMARTLADIDRIVE